MSCVYSTLRSLTPIKSLYAGAAEGKMVLPEDLGDCAQNGDQDRVFAWLAAGGDINDTSTPTTRP